MRKKSTRLTASTLLVVSFAALAWYFLAPAKLGGHTSYVVTHGVSMEPQFHTGDLAVLRASSEYHVGDVVGYHSATLGTVVMHRIVADDGGALTFKGDNNTWIDPDHPTKADLVGRLAVRVPHGGRYIAALDSTPGRCVAGGVVALLLLGGAGRARRRRALRTSGGRHRAGTRRAPTPRPFAPVATIPQAAAATLTPTLTPTLTATFPRRVPRAQALTALGALVALVAAGGWLLSLSPTAPTTRTIVVQQTGTFGYSADVTSSVVYPDGLLHSGEPIFTQIARSVDFSFDYRADAPLTGSVALAATLVGPSGWTSPLAAGVAAPVRGGSGHATVTVDLARAQAALDAFTATTGVMATSMSVVLTPKLDATGAVGGQPLAATVDGKLTLAAGANQLIVVKAPAPDGAATASDDPLVLSAPVDVKAPATAARTLHLLGWHVTVLDARVAAGVGAIAALGWLVALLVGSRRTGLTGRAEDDVDAALRRYGDRIVDAEPMPLDGPVVDLTSLAALHSIAERYDRVILHTTRGARHSYLVRDELSWYRYDVRPDRPQHAARRDGVKPGAGADVVVLDAPVITLEPRSHAFDILPGISAGAVGPSAWAEGYARAS
jgi:signal peptidase I